MLAARSQVQSLVANDAETCRRQVVNNFFARKLVHSPILSYSPRRMGFVATMHLDVPLTTPTTADHSAKWLESRGFPGNTRGNGTE